MQGMKLGKQSAGTCNDKSNVIEKNELDDMENVSSTTTSSAGIRKSQRRQRNPQHVIKASKSTRTCRKIRIQMRGETSLKELAQVSETADTGGCTFSCPMCSFFCSSAFGMSSHLKTRHKCIKTRNKCEKYLSTATVHNCRICSEKLFCESNYLSQHMLKHNITINQYRKQFDCQVSWKRKIQQVLETSKLSQNKIGNMCMYMCPQCKKTFMNFESLSWHGRKCGDHPIGVKIRNILDFVTNIVSHKCKICSMLLFCDMRMITYHISGKHRIRTVKEYASRTGCLLPTNESEDKKKDVLSKGIKPNNEVGNLCRYTCDNCGYTAKTWKAMKNHLSSKNHWSSKGKDWFRYITKTVLHDCKICRKELLNEKEFIYCHLMKAHEKNWLSYVKKYRLSQVDSTTHFQ